jgi:hypothetical protein
MLKKRLAEIFLPRTKLGEWPVGLILIFFILLEIFRLLVESGERGGEALLGNLKLAVPVLLAGVAAVAAFFTGLISIIRYKERSLSALLASLVGLFVLIFWLGEAL